MDEKVLDFVLMEIETKSLDEEVYRYRTHWGISVVYYMVDFRLAFKGVFEPIYLSVADVSGLECEQGELFNRILSNTMTIMRIDYMSFSTYLRELKGSCAYAVDARLIDGISKAMDSERKQHRLLCITSSIRDRGTVGAFSTELLQRICREQGAEKILIGIGCNDYALVYCDTHENIRALERFTYRIGNVREFASEILERDILVYDSTEDILKQWTGNSQT